MSGPRDLNRGSPLARPDSEAQMKRARLDNIAPILVSSDVRRTAECYRDVLGFELVEHYDNPEPFATLYRDTVEIVVVQAVRG